MLALFAAILLTLYTSYAATAFTTLPKSTSLLSLLSRSRPLEKRALVSELWVPEDTYQGPTFFEYVFLVLIVWGLWTLRCRSTWDFFNQSDPTQ